MVILDNIRRARERIEAAAARAGRNPAAVELVAVTKYASMEQTLEALKSGRIRHIGESRVQDAAWKREQAALEGRPAVAWRMIGRLQTNKAAKALEIFDALDCLDSLRLAQALDARLAQAGKTLPVLVQVKLSGRETQSGVEPEALEDFIAQCRRYPRLRIEGLMAIAPMLDPVERTRPCFRRLKDLSDRISRGLRDETRAPWLLSMGMSRDFEIAVEEGSTMVRLGSVLFDLDGSHIAGRHSKGG